MQIIDSGGSISVAYVIPDTTLMNESSWYVICIGSIGKQHVL